MVFLGVSWIAIAKRLEMGSTRRAELQDFGARLFNKREKRHRYHYYAAGTTSSVREKHRLCPFLAA
jgi:hypothetical protein